MYLEAVSHAAKMNMMCLSFVFLQASSRTMSLSNGADRSSMVSLIERMHSLGVIAIDRERISAIMSDKHKLSLEPEDEALVEALRILVDDKLVSFWCCNGRVIVSVSCQCSK